MHCKYSTSPGQRGFTLIELMIAMVIGLVVMGAVFAAYLASANSTRSGRAVAQMTEDATVAINILRSHVAEGGYSRPVGPAASGTLLARAAGTAPGSWLFGCDLDFADTTKPIDQLTCGTVAGGHNTVAVAYEANLKNSVTTVNAAGETVPTDCLGAALTKTTSGGIDYYLSYSQFYLSNNALYCRGPGSTTGQPLVENIQDMQITYGVGGAASPDTTRVVTYKDAADVAALGPWSRVLSVRVCLILRSEDAVAEAPDRYQGCDPFAVGDARPAAPDKHLYRAFTTTIVLHNRMGVPA
ncbi:PilW family protein [Ideonella azotifigens]|uniref:Prepilin-type N-terminal cleavage/methylation domain-containing protein n=1 Tax=Ideonella azotifigens TaxID=513160 RepID=A0ABN1K6L9_9BURK|nr:PilW family protein [Ideonella azotifigens]MCD2342117.1 PilW family protein [Ideonella azotifigens]